MYDAFMFFFFGLLLSTALYGTFSLPVAVLAFYVSLKTMFEVIFKITGFIDVFYAFMIWAPIAYILLSLLHYLIVKIKGDADSFWSEQISTFVASFSNPWRGLVALAGASKTIDSFDLYGLYCWIQVIVHFVWSLGLFGFIGYGFYLIAK